MNNDKRNLLISWGIGAIAVAAGSINTNFGLMVILFAYPFREIEQEKRLFKEFKKENIKYFKAAIYLTLAMSLAVLIYTLYRIALNPVSSEALPGFWTIMIILLPIFSLGFIHEIHLLKTYSRSA